MSLTLNVPSVAYEQIEAEWLPGLNPYRYQWKATQLVQEALDARGTLCLFLITPTGSGKTLASYAYSILNDHKPRPALGVYPTNALIQDQYEALQPWLDPDKNHRLLKIDSQTLDCWQDSLDLRQHSATLEVMMNWSPTILTNPDILFYIFFGLYTGPNRIRQRLWELVAQYHVFVFDEFHLYNVKQMADTALFVSTLNAVNPQWGRLFIFASATPEIEMVGWLRDQLALRVEILQATPSKAPHARTVAHPLQLTVVPAELDRWQGTRAIVDTLPLVDQFVDEYPGSRIVAILDSVRGAIEVARTFRDRCAARRVGEIHGISSTRERASALRQPITIGTSTIEVGIDFKDDMEKDILIFEARTASQWIQRFGRLARHPKTHNTPNWVLAFVPEYVYHFLKENTRDTQTLERPRLYELIREAYLQPQVFPRYLTTHAPAEFYEAKQIVQSLFQPDDRPRILSSLDRNIETLTGAAGGQANRLYNRYKKDNLLSPLLTFRGAGFEAAILDERGSDPGFPAKRYNLLFLLRQGVFEEIDEASYQVELEKLKAAWPLEVAREQRFSKPIKPAAGELLGVYGYFRFTALRDESRKVWFEVDADSVYGKEGAITVIQGLQIATDPPLPLRALNKRLRRKKVVAWFIDRHPAAIQRGRALPPLFEIFRLNLLHFGPAESAPWSIAFNQNAFFLDSLGWNLRQSGGAIIP